MKNAGDCVGNIHSSNDRIGFIIVQDKDIYLAEKACLEAINCVSIVTG